VAHISVRLAESEKAEMLKAEIKSSNNNRRWTQMTADLNRAIRVRKAESRKLKAEKPKPEQSAVGEGLSRADYAEGASGAVAFCRLTAGSGGS